MYCVRQVSSKLLQNIICQAHLHVYTYISNLHFSSFIANQIRHSLPLSISLCLSPSLSLPLSLFARPFAFSCFSLTPRYTWCILKKNHDFVEYSPYSSISWALRLISLSPVIWCLLLLYAFMIGPLIYYALCGVNEKKDHSFPRKEKKNRKL